MADACKEVATVIVQKKYEKRKMKVTASWNFSIKDTSYHFTQSLVEQKVEQILVLRLLVLYK